MTNALTNTMLAWLLTYAIHSTVLLGLAWLIGRRTSIAPAVRDFTWKVALVGGIVTATAQTQLGVHPAGSLAVPGASVAAVPRTQAAPARPVDVQDKLMPDTTRYRETSTASASPEADVTVLDTAIVTADGSASAAAGTPARLSAPGTIAVITWAVVAVLLSLFWFARRLILLGRLGDRRMVTEGALPAMLDTLRVTAKHRGRIRLTSSVTISSPVALGVGEICVPEAALTDLDAEQQRGLLAHELAHLARRDPLWLDAAGLVERVFFFQPLNRLARREFQQVAEYLCDDWAAARTGSGVPLAKCLARVAEWIQASPLSVPVAGMAEQRSLLVARIARLIEGKTPSSPLPRLAFVAATVVLLGAMVAAAPGVQDAAPIPPQAPSPPAGPAPRLAGPLVGPIDVRIPRFPIGVLAGPRLSGRLMGGRESVPADSGIVDALIDRLKDTDAGVRRAAASSLGNLRSRRAVTALIAALDDHDREVRGAAANALGEIEDNRAVGPLTQLIKDPSADVRERALNALSNLARDDVPAGPVLTALHDAKAGVREQAAQLLGRIGDRVAVGPLISVLHDPVADVRVQALDALKEIKDPSAATAITAALKDEHPGVRRTALEALRELKVLIPEKVVLEALEDPSAEVRRAAVELAGERPFAAVVPMLKKLLEDPSSDVRVEAVGALGEIGDASARETLRAALKSKDARVRQRAAEVLGDRR